MTILAALLSALAAAPLAGQCPGGAAETAAYEAYAVREGVRTAPAQPALKVFDNLYFVGIKSTAAWAIDTPDGIILIDALKAADAETIPAGLTALGLDPKRIRYILVTHGHGDHFGGAVMLQRRYGARVVMGAPDWPFAETDQEPGEPPPARDLDAGGALRLGGTTIRILPTPGHTPGTVSLIFPVTDHGRRHVVALPGGLGGRHADPATAIAALKRWRDEVVAARADVLISNHPYNDQALAKMRALATRRPGQPHPFVLGREAVRDRLDQVLACARR